MEECSILNKNLNRKDLFETFHKNPDSNAVGNAKFTSFGDPKLVLMTFVPIMSKAPTLER